MGITWILCANGSRARLFEAQPHSDTPQEVADFVNPAGRAHERDLRSDAAGRLHGKAPQSSGGGSVPGASIGEHETERFAESLRAYLERARSEQRFGQLWIVAAPAFLGLLRRNFGKELREMVEFELDRDFTGESPRDVFMHALEARGGEPPIGHRIDAHRP